MTVNDLEDLSLKNTTTTRTGKRKRNTGITRKKWNEFEAKLACQKEQIGQIDTKIEHIFQILLNRTDNEPLRNEPEVCTDTHMSLNNTDSEAGNEERNRKFGRFSRPYSRYKRGHFRCASSLTTRPDGVMSKLVIRQDSRT